nr:copper resistance protein CopC/CopD [Ktedonobacteraceae bacterium]
MHEPAKEKHSSSHFALFCCALLLGMGFALLSLFPFGLLNRTIPFALAHALLLRSDPAANAVLNAPPPRIRLFFSEDLNDLTSRIVVVDTTNHQVDNDDSSVASSDSREMDISLPLLKTGTYVVVWRSQSAEDGHIATGSFLFRIADPDGNVPPIPAVLPTGHFPGAAGVAGNTTLDAPTIFQTIMTWLALLFMTFWVGGVLWETWILPPGSQKDGTLAQASRRAGEAFRNWAPYPLAGVILCDIGIVLAQAAELTGSESGAFSLPVLRAVLFGSAFGRAWWIRQGIACAAALLLLLVRQRHLTNEEETTSAVDAEKANNNSPDDVGESEYIPPWAMAVKETLRGIPRIPRLLFAGVRQRSWPGRVELLFALALIVAFALSGHAAAVSASQRTYALGVDLLHLLCTTLWVGGLLYIALILVPAQAKLSITDRARVLAQGLPAFGALAFLGVLVLASTGSLNTTIHLTAFEQLFTTLYGRILVVKISLFLMMIIISAYHAFFLRSQLTEELKQQEAVVEDFVSVPALIQGQSSHHVHQGQDDRQSLLRIQTLNNRLSAWLQREAVLGTLILLCVAFLAAFAGTLAPPPPPVSATSQANQQPAGPYVQTQTAHGYRVTLQIAPATFGTNTFTVTLKDM